MTDVHPEARVAKRDPVPEEAEAPQEDHAGRRNADPVAAGMPAGMTALAQSGQVAHVPVVIVPVPMTAHPVPQGLERAAMKDL
jgi:hypothetical protein